MIKMIIKMDDDKIKKQGQYSVEQIYSALDRIFTEKGMQKLETNRGIEYLGHDKSADFALFGQIALGLKNQPDTRNATKYWSVLKTRLRKEGSELTTNCSQLKSIIAVVGENLQIAV